MTTNNNELIHYGVLGMKWGVRRARSKSSSSGGGKRRGLKSSFKKIVNKRKSKSVKNMSNEELRARINRLQLEKQYKSLKNEVRNPAKKFAQDVIKDVGSQMVKDVTKNAAGYGVNKVTGKKVFKSRYGK